MVSALNLSVIGATGQIGMLRAMGASASSIQRIFILQSGILGLMGTLAGTFAGVLIALTIGQYEVPSVQNLTSMAVCPLSRLLYGLRILYSLLSLCFC
ncbi:FtsX-like permease family protein [Methanosarcina sp. DH2]|uniref:FtsX-like permease family protein n=1 Tax=Methanosarcina sp. DH2 TaxID=2605639 RepID=UPI001E48F4F6|nr:FtsX-like permease family protein [Methanosarcina sp. DH2]